MKLSGGSLNYLYGNFADSLNITPGCYGILEDNNDDNYEVAKQYGKMEDEQLNMLMYDISCLLNSLEWYLSSDIGREDYINDVNKFKEKWLKNKTDDYDFILLETENKKLKEDNCKLLERIEYLEICLQASQNKSENENLGNRCIRDIFLTR